MTPQAIIHQFTAVFAERDAVGQHTLAVETLLRDMGCQVTTFAERSKNEQHVQIHDYRTHSKHPTPNAVIYQMSTGSMVGDYLLNCSFPLILNYHNITPSFLFSTWAPHMATNLILARQQLTQLSTQTNMAIADSYYNALELRSLGISHIQVVPIIHKHPISSVQYNHSNTIGPYNPLLLFVGRLVPNKRIETLIMTTALLRELWPQVHLTLIGTPLLDSYHRALQSLVATLQLDESVTFLGSVPDTIRDHYYSMASIYVSASIHEGFCVPLIEAMNVGLPVVARAAAAVPETAGNAAILIPTGEPIHFASAIARMLEDNKLRHHMINQGFKRAEFFSSVSVQQQMRQALQSCIEYIL